MAVMGRTAKRQSLVKFMVVLRVGEHGVYRDTMRAVNESRRVVTVVLR